MRSSAASSGSSPPAPRSARSASARATRRWSPACFPNELRLYESEGSEPDARYAQGEGWLEVFANRARVLIAEAVEPDKLDTSELKSKLEDAEKRLEEAEEGSAAEEQAERDKARAEAFMTIAEGS